MKRVRFAPSPTGSLLGNALSGRGRGPELASTVDALPRDEALRRVDVAL